MPINADKQDFILSCFKKGQELRWGWEAICVYLSQSACY